MSRQGDSRMARWGLIAVLALGLLAVWGTRNPASAQDGEGEEEFPIIFGHQAEVVFPAVIRCVVGVNAVPDDIESITLIVSQESGLAHTFVIDRDAALMPAYSGGVANQFLFEWRLDGEPSPVLFEPVAYRWEVAVRGQPLAVAEGDFLAADTGHGSWRMAGRPPVMLHWLNRNLAGQIVWDEIMAAYGLLDRQMDSPPAFEFAIYDPDARLCESVRDEATGEVRQVVQARGDPAEYPCSAELFAQVYARSGITFVQRPTFGLAELEDTLIAAMVSQTYGALWGDAGVPAWFEGGLAALYRLRPGSAALELARSAARTGQLFPLDALQAPLPETTTYASRALWEAQSYTLALMLADRYGAEAPFDLARAAGQESGGFAGALRSLTGGDQQALWDAWQGWLFAEEALRAAGWMPYLPETPTPTATLTASPVPPTRTPSATRTPTVTPTERVLGVQPQTVVVRQASPTPRLAPTNTPLPPGSLPPAPPRQPSGEGGGIDPAVLGVIAGVAALILLLAGAILAARRRRT